MLNSQEPHKKGDRMSLANQEHNQFEESHEDETFHIESHESSHDEGWLVSYADLMTLLFGFFVIMYSISSVDKAKLEELKKMASQQFSKQEYKTPGKALASQITRDVEQLGISNTEVEIQTLPEGIKLVLRGRTFFESGISDISAKGGSFIRDLSRTVLADPESFTEIRVDGHTDNMPIQTARFPSNWELSTSRASAVVKELIAMGLPAKKLSASGYADSHPLLPNVDPNNMNIAQNQEQNRRVEIFIKLPNN